MSDVSSDETLPMETRVAMLDALKHSLETPTEWIGNMQRHIQSALKASIAKETEILTNGALVEHIRERIARDGKIATIPTLEEIRSFVGRADVVVQDHSGNAQLAGADVENRTTYTWDLFLVYAPTVTSQEAVAVAQKKERVDIVPQKE